MDYFRNEEQFLRVQKFLGAVGAKFGLTPDLAIRIKPVPTELYINTKFSAGGTAHLLSGNSTQEVGVTNFDGNRLEAGRFFVIDSVTIQYGEDEDSKKVWEVKYGDNLPEVLLSSHLLLKQSGEVIMKMPISAIQNAKEAQTYYRKLEALALIEPLQQVEFQIETPAGSSITTTGSKKSFVRVLLKGFETYLRR